MTFQIRKAAAFCQARRLRGCAAGQVANHRRASNTGIRLWAGPPRVTPGLRRAGGSGLRVRPRPGAGRGLRFIRSRPSLAPRRRRSRLPSCWKHTHTMRKRNLQLACRSTSASRIAKFCGIARARGPGAPVGERAVFGGAGARQFFAPGQPAALPSLTQTPSGWRVRATLAQSCVRRTSTGDTTCWMYMRRLPPSV